MATAMLVFQSFDGNGIPVEGGNRFLPDYLDWLPIQVKAEWFKHLGMGNPEAKDVLLSSQGQRLLIKDVTLRNLKHSEYEEKQNGIEEHINRFIEENGYSRDPRNQ